MSDSLVARVDYDLKMSLLEFFLENLKTIDFDDGKICFLSPLVQFDLLFKQMILHGKYMLL